MPDAVEHRRAALRAPGAGGDAARGRRHGRRRLLARRRRPRRPRIDEVLARGRRPSPRSPTVVAAPRAGRPVGVLQPYAESVRQRHRHRLHRGDGARPHPLHPPRPGRRSASRSSATSARALAGGTVHRAVHRHARRVGARRRAGRDGGGTVVGLVSVGITTERDQPKLLRQAPGAVRSRPAPRCCSPRPGAWLLSRRLRRQTHGLGPAEMTRMYEYYDAVLHAVREGLRAGRRPTAGWQLVNDEGRRLLGLPDDVRSTARSPSSACRPRPPRCSARARTRADEPTLAGDRVLVASQRRPASRAASSARCSPCATTPSCAR